MSSSMHTDIPKLHFNLSAPFYYSDRPRCFSFFSDKGLALIAPLITYWSLYLLYRGAIFLHAPRNRRSRKRQPLRLVLEIQLVQTLFVWVWMTRFGKLEGSIVRDSKADMESIARVFSSFLPSLIGKANAQSFIERNGADLAYFAYWWAIPIAKQFFAPFTIDLWQCFLRFLQVDRYLYADVYAFLFDTVGICLAYSLSQMSYRETAVFLTLSVVQTFGKRPRPPSPKSSLHPHIPVDKDFPAVLERNTLCGPFMGFRRQMKQFAYWYMFALNVRSVESLRVQRAMQVARHQQVSGQKRPRPQLRLDMSCL